MNGLNEFDFVFFSFIKVNDIALESFNAPVNTLK